MHKLFETEDLWSIWLGFFLFLLLPYLETIPEIMKWDTQILSALSMNISMQYILISVCMSIVFGFAVKMMKESFFKYIIAFPILFLLAFFALILSAQVTVTAYGLGYAFWALLIGLLISNTIGVSPRLKPALKTEFYIKTGLVLLGAEILFPKMMDIGVPALIVAWVVTPIVIIAMYYFGTKYLKLGKNLSIVIATATSVCGVSAAIAASAASNAKKEELTLAVSMTLIFTVIMMIFMPVLVQYMDLSPAVGGAWIGGTIDATGAVVAAGAVLGEEAMNVAAIVKMIQNIMIGVVAFVIALIWTANIHSESQSKKMSFFGEIWERMPKFILGFLSASLLFSFVLFPLVGEISINEYIDTSKSYRGLLFTLAFVSIGLESNFKELGRYMSGGKPIILYFFGQSLNILLTLALAWLVFGKTSFAF